MSRRTTKQRRAARRREEAVFQATFGFDAWIQRKLWEAWSAGQDSYRWMANITCSQPGLKGTLRLLN